MSKFQNKLSSFATCLSFFGIDDDRLFFKVEIASRLFAKYACATRSQRFSLEFFIDSFLLPYVFLFCSVQCCSLIFHVSVTVCC